MQGLFVAAEGKRIATAAKPPRNDRAETNLLRHWRGNEVTEESALGRSGLRPLQRRSKSHTASFPPRGKFRLCLCFSSSPQRPSPLRGPRNIS